MIEAIVLVALGFFVFLNILGLLIQERVLSDAIEELRREHMKTRKDLQEIKTRLTQVRKDLNKLEKDLEKYMSRSVTYKLTTKGSKGKGKLVSTS